MNNLIREVLLILLIASTVFTLPGCKNDDGELYRNWIDKDLSSFEGPTRMHAISFVIGDSGYVGEAYSAGTAAYIKGFWAYNTQTKVWSQVADFPGSGQKGATAFVAKGKAYIVDGKVKCDVWEYNPRANGWTK